MSVTELDVAPAPTGATTPAGARAVTPVGLIAEHLATALRVAEEQGGLDPQVRDEIERAHLLARGLDPYLSVCSGPESTALQALSEVTRATDWAGHEGEVTLEQEMLSGHVEGRFLQMLVRITGARRVLEIGMFTGYSALALAEALPDDGSVVACEIDALAAEIAAQAFAGSPAGGRIEVRMGPALDTLHLLAEEQERFDLVFVDADKAGYVGYLDALLDLGLLADGALVCVDNTLMQGQPWAGGHTANGVAIADFNQRVSDDPRLDQVLVPLRDGITLIRRKDVS
jgi:caffeoyl-CoA O-methyltransferase